MNKLEQIKLKKNIALMKESSQQCIDFLVAYVNGSEIADMPNSVVATEFNKVIQHQKNMINLFGIMEQKL